MSEEMNTVKCEKCGSWIAWPFNCDDDPICIECANDPISRSEAAELRAQLATAQARISELESYIDKRNQRVLSAFERTAPLDWRTDDETPLGQMLDGIGDEVEP